MPITNESKQAIKARITQLQTEKDEIVKSIADLDARKDVLVTKRQALVQKIQDLKTDVPD